MPNIEKYGIPAIEFGPLRLWVHARECPEATDAWDGNWLRITAHCAEPGGAVLISGALLDTVSFLRWHRELSRVYQDLRGEAVLESVEPNLRVVVTGRGGTGHLAVRIEMTPEHMTQGHWFVFEVDQTFLTPLIDQVARLLREYPVRQPQGRGV